ncbi:MAG: hypothetical protein GC186_16395 [Rhodobacteraceae bacterium]|nr:hypothetical protein [Paracoccaceae bacterium]
MTPPDTRVDALLRKAEWQEERQKLRAICLACGLTEAVKWGKLCYTFEGNNVAIIYGLKESCALGFLKGALLDDPDGILAKAGENSQAGRWIKFTDVQQIAAMAPVLTGFLHAAIAVEKAGLKIDFKARHDLVLAEEFQHRLDEDPGLKAAFEALTPGRQRSYALHFAAPKQSKTRAARVEKCVQDILDGRGLNGR